MSYQVLARKWRPRTFTELVGQDHVQRALINALDNDRLHHAYLFTGTRGVGKTTIARIFSKSLNCEEGVGSSPCGQCSACREIDEGRFVDLIEVDAASRTKVEDTRDLLENVQYAPTRGRYKVYLIDEVHMLSGHSFNALLKTLEEPPPHVKFLLATTDPQKLPVTILSRCLQFNLKSLTLPQIISQLETILEKENINTDEGAVQQLALAANGSMRDALSLMDQAISFGGGELKADEVRAMLGTIDRDVVYRLLDALAQQDAAQLMEQVAQVDEFVPEYGALLADLISVLQRVAMAQSLPDAIDDSSGDREVVIKLAEKLAPEDVQLYYQIALVGRRDLSLSPDPRGGFEMVLLRMLAFRPAVQDVAIAPADKSASKPASKSGGADAVSKRSAGDSAGSLSKKEPVSAHSDEWGKVIASLSVRGMVREMALNCIFHGIKNDIVRLSLDPGHVHLHSKDRQEILQQSLCDYYQKTVTVKLGREQQPVSAETPARKQVREQDERQQHAVESIENDANIKALQDVFDGTLQRDTIRPRD